MAGMKLKKRLNTVYVIISSNICIFVSKSQQSSEVQLEIPCIGILHQAKNLFTCSSLRAGYELC